MNGIWIGTSGWIYKHWAATFYPQEMPKGRELQHYAREFPTVEINATFYRLPPENMVNGWRNKAPDGFIYAVKGSRFITHIKRLKEAEEALKNYFEHVRLLKEKLGPILWQLPPTFAKSDENFSRVERFLELLPKKFKHAVEFRHPSWNDDSVIALLKKFNVANVWLSSLRMPMNFAVTADFIYLRFHGLENGAAHDYTEAELKPWAEQLLIQAREGRPAYVYFNNDWNTRAPLNAKMLMRLAGDFAIAPFPSKEELPIETPKKSGRRVSKKPDFSEPRSKRLTRK